MSSGTPNYWWIKINPKWELEKLHERRTFECKSHNEKGNKRRIFKSFETIKPGELVVLYVTSPQRMVVSICKVTKGLSSKKQGEIKLQIVKRLTNPIPYETLQSVPELKTIQPFRVRQGTLFSLTEHDFNLLCALARRSSSEHEDIERINHDKTISSTTKKTLINARRGQGRYGGAVRKMWQNRCSVTGLATKAVLEASHIKGWSDSDHAERLDPYNGLLLTANLHRLFDARLISFEDSGKMLASSKLSQNEQRRLGLPGRWLFKRPPKRTAKYLNYHRADFLRLDGRLPSGNPAPTR